MKQIADFYKSLQSISHLNVRIVIFASVTSKEKCKKDS